MCAVYLQFVPSLKFPPSSSSELCLETAREVVRDVVVEVGREFLSAFFDFVLPVFSSTLLRKSRILSTVYR